MSVVFRKMTLDDLAQVIAIDQTSFSLPWFSNDPFIMD